MRLYSADNEEALRARKLLRDWASEGLLTTAQYEALEPETASGLRTTNVFLRAVLFLFTLFAVVAAVPLFNLLFLSRPSVHTVGIVNLIFAAACYAAAETAVFQARFYRYGIEEALAVCSVGLLCWGLDGAFFNHQSAFLVPTAGAILSLWIWHRFGLWYAFLAAMVFAIFLPGHWTSSHSAQHAILAAFYAAGLICVAARRSRHRLDSFDHAYSIAEALLWLGIHLAINLKSSALSLPALWLVGGTQDGTEFARPFYWTTWVLTWCLPPIVLVRGVRQKDRFVLAVGAITAVLTFVSNKPYLGWQRHTWDPMLLGILLAGAAWFLRRWLARGSGGVRHGFTAARQSGTDQRWMNAGFAVMGLMSLQSITPDAQTSGPDSHFGGGASGGAGASGDF